MWYVSWKKRVCIIYLQHIVDFFLFLWDLYLAWHKYGQLSLHTAMDTSQRIKLASFYIFKNNTRKPLSQHCHRYLTLAAFPIAFYLLSKTSAFYIYLRMIIWPKKSLPHFYSCLWTITGYFLIQPFKIISELGFCHPWDLHPLGADYTGCVLTLGKKGVSYKKNLCHPTLKGFSSGPQLKEPNSTDLQAPKKTNYFLFSMHCIT